jgi:hypothetical protein
MKKIIIAFSLLALIQTVISKIKCGYNYWCPDGTTCCLKPLGYKNSLDVCCPHENGVCCSDHINCCPNGYTCNFSINRCEKGNNSFLAFVTLKDNTPLSKTTENNYSPDNQDYKFLLDIQECGKLDQRLGNLALLAFREFKFGTIKGRELARSRLDEILKQKITKGTKCHEVTEKLILLLN